MYERERIPKSINDDSIKPFRGEQLLHNQSRMMRGLMLVDIENHSLRILEKMEKNINVRNGDSSIPMFLMN